MTISNKLLMAAAGNTSGVEFVGYATGTSNGTDSITLDLTSLADGIDTAPAEGDLMLIGMSYSDTTANYLNFPSGYSNMASTSVYTGSLFFTTLRVGYKIMPSTVDTSYTITGQAATNRGSCATVLVFRGASASAPTGGIGSNTGSFDVSEASLTIGEQDSTLFTFATALRPTNPCTYSTSDLDYINNGSPSGSTTSVVGIWGYSSGVSSGATGTITLTHSGSDTEDTYAGNIYYRGEITKE